MRHIFVMKGEENVSHLLLFLSGLLAYVTGDWISLMCHRVSFISLMMAKLINHLLLLAREMD